MVSVATFLSKNDGAKIAPRWCRGSKNYKRQKLAIENCKFMLRTFFNKSILLRFGNVLSIGILYKNSPPQDCIRWTLVNHAKQSSSSKHGWVKKRVVSIKEF